MRQIVLDTETTGLEPDRGHRIIEIGGVEVVNRKLTGRHFHKYVNPLREVDDGAFEVHGISQEFLADKPLFADVADDLVDFIQDAELVIHNAPFDVGFLDYEFAKLAKDTATPKKQVGRLCSVVDSLAIARQKHPGQKNNLDALCRRYMVDNSQRQLHGALLDAEILADVYLLMTGGQTSLFGRGEQTQEDTEAEGANSHLEHVEIKVVRAAAEELSAHEAYLEFIESKSGAPAIWRRGDF